MKVIKKSVGKCEGWFSILWGHWNEVFQNTVFILLVTSLKSIWVPSALSRLSACSYPTLGPAPPSLPYQCTGGSMHLISIQGFVFCAAEMMHLPWPGPGERRTCPSRSQTATSLLFTFCPIVLGDVQITPKSPRPSARNWNIRPHSRGRAWVDGEMQRKNEVILFISTPST